MEVALLCLIIILLEFFMNHASYFSKPRSGYPSHLSKHPAPRPTKPESISDAAQTRSGRPTLDQIVEIISRGLRDRHSQQYIAHRIIETISRSDLNEMANEMRSHMQTEVMDRLLRPILVDRRPSRSSASAPTTPSNPRSVLPYPIPLEEQSRLGSITEVIPERELSDPRVRRTHRDEVADGTYFYADVEGGELFIDGISATDIRQTVLGDCYFMASLAAVAQTNPDFIRNAITDNGDGTYTVRFGDPDNPRDVVTIDDDFLQDRHGNLIYGRSTQRGELWVAIMEKAYATIRGNNYNNIARGGYPAPALHRITGIRSRNYLSFMLTRRRIGQLIERGARNNRPMTACTRPTGPELQRRGLATRHVYTVLGTVEEDGETFVQLRNPWGRGEWNGRGADNVNDGIFKMPLRDFKRHFIMFSIAKETP